MWHNLSTKDVEIKLETNLKDGLTDEEVAERLKKYGEGKHFYKIFETI